MFFVRLIAFFRGGWETTCFSVFFIACFVCSEAFLALQTSLIPSIADVKVTVNCRFNKRLRAGFDWNDANSIVN
jgi:hypothetical protein